MLQFLFRLVKLKIIRTFNFQWHQQHCTKFNIMQNKDLVLCRVEQVVLKTQHQHYRYSRILFWISLNHRLKHSTHKEQFSWLLKCIIWFSFLGRNPVHALQDHPAMHPRAQQVQRLTKAQAPPKLKWLHLPSYLKRGHSNYLVHIY